MTLKPTEERSHQAKLSSYPPEPQTDYPGTLALAGPAPSPMDGAEPRGFSGAVTWAAKQGAQQEACAFSSLFLFSAEGRLFLDKAR